MLPETCTKRTAVQITDWKTISDLGPGNVHGEEGKEADDSIHFSRRALFICCRLRSILARRDLQR